ncbi:MAG TPA: SAM-dependent methyltransferase, partial [Candidatus Dormibacteraeota bacterium]|nr:SAM-dependent methyltransferase [Candidatus Dormibacteraeota bacterium]
MSKLREKIVTEIRTSGVIPFPRFMELALYCPVFGYYEKEADRIGRLGDFFTSVSVGPLFGSLLAWQFAEWLGNDLVHLVEAGAHRGELARDILRWLKAERSQLFARVQYQIVEPSDRQQKWQRQTLQEFGAKVEWLETLGEGQAINIRGVIFSNELLDAMPVRRLAWDAKEAQWFEWGVGVEKENLAWRRMPLIGEPPFPENLRALLRQDLLEVLPDGFVVEICPAAEHWWLKAARALKTGKLVSLDYGFSGEEVFRPERAGGTLRAYGQHRSSDDLLANPGAQDITAHVNFESITQVGEKAGLTTSTFSTQANFLTGILSRLTD